MFLSFRRWMFINENSQRNAVDPGPVLYPATARRGGLGSGFAPLIRGVSRPPDRPAQGGGMGVPDGPAPGPFIVRMDRPNTIAKTLTGILASLSKRHIYR